MKKYFTLILLALLPIVGYAYSAEIDGIYYNFSGDEATVTYENYSYNSYSGTVVIPETVTYNGKTYSVTGIGSSAFRNCSGLTSVTIPNSVTSIDYSAFYNCSGLTSVTIPNSVTSIGDYAFEDCSGLTSVTIPNSVTSIGGSAFYGCRGLTSVTIPNSVTSIGSGAFYDCSGLTSVIIGNSVTSIGYGAFDDCSSLITVTLESDAIVSAARDYRASMSYIFGSQVQEYILGNDVTSIGDNAFYGCSSLTSLTIGNGVTSIGEDSFYGCESLQYNEYDEALYLGNGENPYVVLVAAKSTEITACDINSQCKVIYSNAFEGCSVLTSVRIPNSLINIGAWAFGDCDSLQYNEYDEALYLGNDENPYVALVRARSADIPACDVNTRCRVICGGAFYECSSLTSVNIPDAVKSISCYTFYGCSSLTSVAIPSSVTTIGNFAFEGCSSLTDITIPNNVRTIGKDAFYYCENLTSVTVGNSVNSIGEAAFYGCESLTSVILESNAIVSVARDYESSISSIFGSQVQAYILGNGITSIGDYAFYNCSGLTSVTIPESVTSIGNYAFEGCRDLTSVTIPESVTTIGYGAFMGCGLTSITIPGSVTSIGVAAFRCESMKYVMTNSDAIISDNGDFHSYMSDVFGEQVEEYVIGDNVKSIGSFAFYNSSGLTSVTIPNSVTNIGRYAFSGCSGLTSIIIPNSVASIGAFAFEGCSSLTSVTIGNSVTYIGENAFYGTAWYYNQPDGLVYAGKVAYRYKGTMPEGTEIILNDGTLGIAGHAFDYCSGLTSVTIPNSVTSIGEDAFSRCSSLTSVTIPNSVTRIGYGAFSECSGLTSINIPNSVTSIESNTFDGCSGLTSITIPNSVTSIGDMAFRYCSGLTSVTIPNSVTSIGAYAFGGCSGLTSIIIPNSVASIGAFAFEGCSSLVDVYCYAEEVPKTIYYWGGSLIFYNVENATLHVPAGSVEAYKMTAQWSGFGTIVALTEDEEDGIKDIEQSPLNIEHSSDARYDLSGRKINGQFSMVNGQLPKGINILRYSDGTTRKVLVK